MEKYDLLIIGGGPAAITVVKNIKGAMKVGVIRPEDYSMIYCAMPYVIEGLMPIEKTFKKDALVTDSKAELIRDTVTKVDFDSKIVTVKDGGEIGYEKLVIATGATPVMPPIEGHNLKGVTTFKTEEDLRNIIKLVENGLKHAVVVGAGAIGIELAQALNEHDVETHIVDMESSILPNMVDHDIVEQAQEALIKSGVHLHLENKVNALKGNLYVNEVVLDNTSIHVDNLNECNEGVDDFFLVAFAVGMKPNVDLFKDSKLNIEKSGIVVNDKMETNIKDVFAIGDCCQYTSAITGEVISGKLATNAVPMGRVLANNLLGRERKYSGFYNGAATKIENYYVGGTGLSKKNAQKAFDIIVGEAEFTSAFPIMPNTTPVKLKLIADKNTHKILGGQCISGVPVTDKVDQISMAIQYGITLEQLLEFSYSSQPYQSFYPAHNLIVKAAENALGLS